MESNSALHCDGSSVRTFVALPLPSEQVKVVGDWIQQLKAFDRENAVRWGRGDQLHLTLCFLGQTRNEAIQPLIDRLQRASSEATSLTLRVHGLGFFPERGKVRVIWADVEDLGAGLISLADAIKHSCGPYLKQPDTKPFRPHLTLGRVRERLHRSTLETMKHRARHFDTGTMRIPSFCLYQSTLRPTGSVYQVLATCPLGTTTR